ncbi:conserved hypothetical protein, partial [sediment metagenome]
MDNTLKLYIETYGCQMNVADSEIVAAILQQHNYALVPSAEKSRSDPCKHML